jgi:hypothetical protein
MIICCFFTFIFNSRSPFASKKLYSEKDLDKAYIDGLECAIVVMEMAINLSYTGQRIMIESLKKVVSEHKMKAVIDRM